MKVGSNRYFQLTPDILLEYDYVVSEMGDSPNNQYEFNHFANGVANSNLRFLSNDNDKKNYFHISEKINEGKGEKDSLNINVNETNFVVSLNASSTKFIKYYTKGTYDKDYTAYRNDKISEIKYEGKKVNGIYFDRMRLHFTSRNFFAGYDGLILQANIFDITRKKTSLLSVFIGRNDTIALNPEPIIVNQKIYTSYLDFLVVSTDTLINRYYSKRNDVDCIYKYVCPEDNPKLMNNTPINVEIYGVKNISDYSGFETYTCEQLNNIVVPCKDSYNNLYIDIKEDIDNGDYFVIAPKLTNNMSFSDFVNTLTDNPENIIILHELSLIENYVTITNEPKSEITHREHYVLNAAYRDRDENGRYYIDEELLNRESILKYRPICIYPTCYSFIIEDSFKIVNTKDNTTIVKRGSYEYGGNNKDEHTNKYGRRIQRIVGNDYNIMNVNVYNKRSNLSDEDIDSVKLTLPSKYRTGGSSTYIDEDGNVAYETNSPFNTVDVGITALCETTNIRISVNGN